MNSHIILLGLLLLNTSGAINAIDVIDYSLQTTRASNVFYEIGHSSVKQKIIDCKDGYVYYYLDISKAEYTSNSNLYIVHTWTEFTPGYVANKNGLSNYDSGRSLGHGYVHLALKEYKNSELNKHGGNISPKTYWPKSSTFETTISSTFGGSVSIGFQNEAELSLGDGASMTVSKGSSTNLTMNFNKSMSTVSNDPIVSTQTSPNNILEAQWSFNVSNKKVAGKATYHMESYFMFEMDKSAVNVSKDAFVVTYSCLFVSSYPVMWWWNSGSDYTSAVDIYCFA